VLKSSQEYPRTGFNISFLIRKEANQTEKC